MKEDMGKIQKDNKQGVVCIRCVRVLCRPSSRYRKAGTGLYTKKRDFLLHYSGAKVSFLFLYHNTGGHAMKNTGSIPKSKLRDVFSTTEQGLSEMQVQKSGKHVGKYTGRGKKTRASEGLFVTVCRFTHCHFADRRAYFHVFRKCREYDCNCSCPGDECSFGNGAKTRKRKNHWTV